MTATGDSATLGAWRRAHGVDGPSDFAKVLLAVELVTEARRRILLERFDGVCRFLAVGGHPDQAIERVARLVDEYRHAGRRPEHREAAT